MTELEAITLDVQNLIGDIKFRLAAVEYCRVEPIIGRVANIASRLMMLKDAAPSTSNEGSLSFSPSTLGEEKPSEDTAGRLRQAEEPTREDLLRMVQNIARQMTVEELERDAPDHAEDADYEGAYDAFILDCRRTLDVEGEKRRYAERVAKVERECDERDAASARGAADFRDHVLISSNPYSPDDHRHNFYRFVWQTAETESRSAPDETRSQNEETSAIQSEQLNQPNPKGAGEPKFKIGQRVAITSDKPGQEGSAVAIGEISEGPMAHDGDRTCWFVRQVDGAWNLWWDESRIADASVSDPEMVPEITADNPIVADPQSLDDLGDTGPAYSTDHEEGHDLEEAAADSGDPASEQVEAPAIPQTEPEGTEPQPDPEKARSFMDMFKGRVMA